MSEDRGGPTAEDTTPDIAYRELVYHEAERLYEFAVLMVEKPIVAQELLMSAFERTWTSLRKDQIYMDVDEAAYWQVTREAAQLLGRTGTRSFQPPTTSDDRHITAVGILDRFPAEQRAAIYLACRMGTDYQFAGASGGIGETRARDVIVAARQEYREAREHWAPSVPDCSRITPFLSARADGQLHPQDRERVEAHLSSCPVCTSTARLFADFSTALKELRLPSPESDVVEDALGIATGQRAREAPSWRRRLVRLATGPLALIPFFIIGAFLLRRCEPVAVDTGLGRTNDIVYARATGGDSILVLDSGNGRELNRLPAGFLALSGIGVFGESPNCTAGGCRTTLLMTDTATGATSTIGNVAGHLHTVATTEQAAYLVDEDAAWNELVVVSLDRGSVTGRLRAPPEIQEAFGPRLPVLGRDGKTLLTLGRQSQVEGLALVSTDLSTLQVKSWLPLPGSTVLGVGLVPSRDGTHVFVYFPAGPTVLDVDLIKGETRQSLGIGEVGIAPGRTGADNVAKLIAADPKGELLYCALPSGGVAVVKAAPFALVSTLATDRQYRAVEVSSDGASLITLGFDGSYQLLDAATGKERYRRPQVRADDILQVNAGA
ncbi:MAG: hypothetical protein EXR58_08010 [Chloroflexi bacterium]|nr:hypothetical protein [Chloroflexota bacterium]